MVMELYIKKKKKFMCLPPIKFWALGLDQSVFLVTVRFNEEHVVTFMHVTSKKKRKRKDWKIIIIIIIYIFLAEEW